MSNSRGRTTSASSMSRNSTGTMINKAQNSASKRITRTKPAWDATNSDLSQHKATSDEIERRKLNAKSKNIEMIKFEKQKQEVLKSKKSQATDAQSQLALLKEILYDDEQIKNLILKSDSTLKVVKDFFEDDSNSCNLKNINKKQAKINLTLAPNVTDLNESNLPHNIQKINDKKSSVIQVKSKNLNDSDNEKSPDSDQELNELASKIKSNNININDLKQVIDKLTHNNESKVNQASKSDHSNENNSFEENPDEQKHHSSSLTSFNDELKRYLNDLETKLSEFEKHLGKQKNANGVIKKSNHSKFGSSSYTINLIQIVSNLLDYLRDTVIELNYEKLKQAESSKQLDIHRKLIDGLTTEVLTVKEQNEKIINNFMAQNAKLAAEMDQIKIFLRTSSLNHNQFYQQMEPKISAFTSQPQLNLVRPIVQQPLQVNGQDERDKFSERLNAMLQYDNPSNNLIKSFSVAQIQNLYNPKQLQNRPLSATFNSQNNLDGFNEQMFKINSNNRPLSSQSQTIGLTDGPKTTEFNTQLDVLKSKNLQVQQRLKQLQEEHKESFDRQSHSSESSTENTSSEEKIKIEALERVKQEQQLLKEQINLLNKQRETAQQELEILSNASLSVTKKDQNYIQSALMKHLEQFSFNFDKIENDNGNTTPGLSPIPPENNQGKVKMNDFKNLEVTPTRK